MIKSNTVLILLLILPVFSFAQKQDEPKLPKNAISLDVYGYSRLYSLNYERVVKQKSWATVIRTGLYVDPFQEKYSSAIQSTNPKTPNPFYHTINLGVDFLKGNNKHFLSLSPTLTGDFRTKLVKLTLDDIVLKRRLGLIFEPRIGYRYQPKPTGFFGRVLFKPLIVNVTPMNWADKLDKKYFRITRNYEDNNFILFYASFGIGYGF